MGKADYWRYDIRCCRCGKFIGQKDKEARCYTYYGRSWDYDNGPPDETFECGKCWQKRTPKDIDRLHEVTWIKPQRWRVIEVTQ